MDRAIIDYLLPEAGLARLEVYDVRGLRITTLVDRVQGAGPQAAVWNGGRNQKQLTSGSRYNERPFVGVVEFQR